MTRVRFKILFSLRGMKPERNEKGEIEGSIEGEKRRSKMKNGATENRVMKSNTNNLARLAFLALVTSVFPVLGLEGCSTHKTETVTTQSPRYTYDSDVPATSTETKTTVTETNSDTEDRGFFHIVGDIISLPFRAVGAVLHAIF